MEVGFFMAKYSYEFKKEIVQEYLNGKGSYNSLAKKYNIPAPNNVKTWVKVYERFGNEGLERSRKHKEYTFEFKISVVQSYLTTEVSYQELALSVGINNPSLLVRWVNDFRIAGPDALREKSKGRKLIMPKPKKVENVEEHAKYLKQLEDENLKLRIENAYLKELRRLRLEEEALNKRRELSVVSEENSN